MEEDDENSLNSGHSVPTKSLGSRSDNRFKPPLPLSPKPSISSGGRERLSESEDSTALAGRLTETDESVHASLDVTSADEVPELQSGVEEDDCVIGSPSVGGGWEVARRFNMKKQTVDSVFDQVAAIMNAEQLVAGTKAKEFKCKGSTGNKFDDATHIAGFGRTHVRMV